MQYLYGCKLGEPPRLVATFDTEEQLRDYVRWATVSERDGGFLFEKGSALAAYPRFDFSTEPRTGDDLSAVARNPTPGLL